MSYWSGDTLELRLPALIEPFDKKQIDCAAYTLHMGAEAYVSPSEAEQRPNNITIKRLDVGEAFTIPAGQFAFLLTEEKVTIPKDAIAFISMRSRVKLRGLVNVSGFHVDPGYDGKLIFGVFNAGPRTAHIRRGEPCFLIWYADLDKKIDEEECEAPESSQKPKYYKTDTGFDAINTGIVNNISGAVMSFEGLSAKIQDLKKEYDAKLHKIEIAQTRINVVGTIVLTLIVGVIFTPFVKSAWEWWTATPHNPAAISDAPSPTAQRAPDAKQPPSKPPAPPQIEK
jgi:dCTP deaminase